MQYYFKDYKSDHGGHAKIEGSLRDIFPIIIK